MPSGSGCPRRQAVTSARGTYRWRRRYARICCRRCRKHAGRTGTKSQLLRSEYRQWAGHALDHQRESLRPRHQCQGSRDCRGEVFRCHDGRGLSMHKPLFIAIALLTAAPAWAAEEPSGCDKFKWNIDHERAALTAPDRVKLASGAELTTLPSTGMTLALSTPADAKLPTPPERGPKEGTFAGFAAFKNAPKPGIYTISLSAGGWVDLVQDGHALKPKAFSGATDCDGIRKTMKYEIGASPFVLQISGARNNALSVAILPSN